MVILFPGLSIIGYKIVCVTTAATSVVPPAFCFAIFLNAPLPPGASKLHINILWCSVVIWTVLMMSADLACLDCWQYLFWNQWRGRSSNLGIRTDFFVIFQVAQNLLKFGMSALVCEENVPVVLSQVQAWGKFYLIQSCIKVHPPLMLRTMKTQNTHTVL